MKFIDSGKIGALVRDAGDASRPQVEDILVKARSLKGLALSEAAALLAAKDPVCGEKILEAASEVKDAIYGRRIVLFAPLYVSNFCENRCVYCAFKADNAAIERRALAPSEIKEEAVHLLQRGHKRILMVAGESTVQGKSPVNYYVEAIRAIYAAEVGPHKIKRVNINCAPLAISEFKELKQAGIGTYQLFQETYHDATYRFVHPSGPKSDPDNRIDAVDRAFKAGIDDVGLGVLYGLYDWRFETLALLMHKEHLEERFGVGPHTLSVPRIEPAAGVAFSERLSWKVSDEDFQRIIAVLRLAVPYTGIILSTRERPEFRDELFGLGVSQVSAESHTAPGGYGGSRRGADGQFTVFDRRSLDDVIGTLIGKDFIPSFCAACYRKERTGRAFMELAKPGTIKGQCSMNALITLKEYLDDFASPQVREKGYGLIHRAEETLDTASKKQLAGFFTGIDKGRRDEFL